MRCLLLLFGMVTLVSFAGPAQAAEPAVAVAGFWTGFIDGFLSLFKLLLSPFLQITLVGDFETWGYTTGYYVGVLAFMGAAGATASSKASEPRWTAASSR